MSKQVLFSVPRSDLTLEFFRAGGKGGQKQNKTSSACRITHGPSGAVGESRDERQQTQNRKLALERMVTSSKFQGWARMQAAIQAEGFASLDRKVDSMMRDKHLRVELATAQCVPGEVHCDVAK